MWHRDLYVTLLCSFGLYVAGWCQLALDKKDPGPRVLTGEEEQTSGKAFTSSASVLLDLHVIFCLVMVSLWTDKKA